MNSRMVFHWRILAELEGGSYVITSREIEVLSQNRSTFVERTRNDITGLSIRNGHFALIHMDYPDSLDQREKFQSLWRAHSPGSSKNELKSAQIVRRFLPASQRPSDLEERWNRDGNIAERDVAADNGRRLQ